MIPSTNEKRVTADAWGQTVTMHEDPSGYTPLTTDVECRVELDASAGVEKAGATKASVDAQSAPDPRTERMQKYRAHPGCRGGRVGPSWVHTVLEGSGGKLAYQWSEAFHRTVLNIYQKYSVRMDDVTAKCPRPGAGLIGVRLPRKDVL